MHNFHDMRLVEDDVCQVARRLLLLGAMAAAMLFAFCPWLSGRLVSEVVDTMALAPYLKNVNQIYNLRSAAQVASKWNEQKRDNNDVCFSHRAPWLPVSDGDLAL